MKLFQKLILIIGRLETNNLEKSLKVGDEIGGHFVYGYVDTTAKVKEIKKSMVLLRCSFSK